MKHNGYKIGQIFKNKGDPRLWFLAATSPDSVVLFSTDGTRYTEPVQTDPLHGDICSCILSKCMAGQFDKFELVADSFSIWLRNHDCSLC